VNEVWFGASWAEIIWKEVVS